MQRAALADAEDRAHDHLERDRLHARMDGERGADGPTVELAFCRLQDRRLVRPHPVAVERRQHHAAAREVIGALEQQQRPRAHQRAERHGSPRRQVVPALGVQRSQHLGRGDHHQRRLEALEHDAERVPVASPAGLHERDRPREPARGLQRGRLGRAGGERGHRRRHPAFASSWKSACEGTSAGRAAARRRGRRGERVRRRRLVAAERPLQRERRRERQLVPPGVRDDLHPDRQPVARRAAADRRRRPAREVVRGGVARQVLDLAVQRRGGGEDGREDHVEALAEAPHRLVERVPAAEQVVGDRARAVRRPDRLGQRVAAARRRRRFDAGARVRERRGGGGEDARGVGVGRASRRRRAPPRAGRARPAPGRAAARRGDLRSPRARVRRRRRRGRGCRSACAGRAAARPARGRR